MAVLSAGTSARAQLRSQSTNGAQADGSSLPSSATSAGLPGGARAPTAVANGNVDETGFAEIVVTANRREETLQRVPTAITTLTGEQLRSQNIVNTQDLSGKVPSLIAVPQGQTRSAENVTLRGQGVTFGAPVGVVNYLAEVPLIQAQVIAIQGAPGTFFDAESVPVLRGPQGTLFGRNATGGALLMGSIYLLDPKGGIVLGKAYEPDKRPDRQHGSSNTRVGSVGSVAA